MEDLLGDEQTHLLLLKLSYGWDTKIGIRPGPLGEQALLDHEQVLLNV